MGKTNIILSDVEATLTTARQGLEDILGSFPKRRLPGLRNLVVFGRAVTNVLQCLRSTEPDFDQWYQPKVAEMRADPLLRYFYTLRTEILKRGRMHTSISGSFSFHTNGLHKFGPPPPNAIRFFMGDQYGGSGWDVQLSDGTVVQYYVNLPSEIGSVDIHLKNAPDEHLGKNIENANIGNLGKCYYEYLENLVHEARQKFGVTR